MRVLRMPRFTRYPLCGVDEPASHSAAFERSSFALADRNLRAWESMLYVDSTEYALVCEACEKR